MNAVSKEDADAEDYVFFLSRNDPAFVGNGELYWFSSNDAVARTHADYWLSADGTKWRLTLTCTIPATGA